MKMYLDKNKFTNKIEKLTIGVPPTLIWNVFSKGLETAPDGNNKFYKPYMLDSSKLKDFIHKISLKAYINNAWQCISLEEHFNEDEIKDMKDWVEKSKNNKKLLRMGVDFEATNRKTYHFLYEIVALFIALKTIPEHKKVILKDIGATYYDLYHRRILAEMVAGYKTAGHNTSNIDLHFITSKGKRPDLRIDNISADIKTMLLIEKDMGKATCALAEWLRNKIIDEENKKQQVESEGSFIIGAWTSALNSMIYNAWQLGILPIYDSSIKCYEKLPMLEKNKVIFVIPTFDAFKNKYIVFNRNTVCNIIDKLCEDGYNKLCEDGYNKYQKSISTKEFVRCPMRTNCEFIVTTDYRDCVVMVKL